MPTENQKMFNKLIEEKQGKTRYRKDSINDIYANIFRIDRPKGDDTKTLEKEFIYENGKFVEAGLDYHKVYTTDFKEYCFLGVERANIDVMIIPRFKSDFKKYSEVSLTEVLNIFSEFKGPSPNDYKKRFFVRYFAQKANQPNATPFDISKEQYKSSPLYIYSKCNRIIFGSNSVKVRKYNNRQIKIASITMPNLKKVLSPFQYFRKSSTLTIRQAVFKKLGFSANFGTGATSSGGTGGSSTGGSGGDSGGGSGGSGDSGGSGGGGGGY